MNGNYCRYKKYNNRFLAKNQVEDIKIMKRLLAALVVMITLAASYSTAVLSVDAYTPEKYELKKEGIVSAYRNVDKSTGFILGIEADTTAHELTRTLIPYGTVCRDEVVKTGSILQATDEDGSIYSLTAIVTGDLDGNGKANSHDADLLKFALLSEELSATAKAAADVNYDGKVSITDLVILEKHVTDGRPLPTPPLPQTDKLVVMLPDSEMKLHEELTVNAASYSSDDEDIALVDFGRGVIVSGKEGSVFIYSKDEDGKILDRFAVTVKGEPTTVSFERRDVSLTVLEQYELSPIFNHPTKVPLTTTSSDDSIVEANALTLTAKSVGTASITVTLDNGQSTSVNVTVSSPISSMESERTIYKVKPGATKQLSLKTEPQNVNTMLTWESADESIAKVDQNGVVTGVSLGSTTITATDLYSGISAPFEVKVCNVKQVALTFDDGPYKYTEELLDLLAEEDVKVTFFLVCEMLSGFPDAVKRQVAEGHEIGYHAYEHKSPRNLSNEQIIADFVKSEKILKKMTGKGFTLWRAPGGNYNDRVCSCIELPHIMWSLDTRDWESKDPVAVYNKIMQNAKDGAVILLHDIHPTTIEGVRLALTEMNEGDYEFLTVTELLSRHGTPPTPTMTYYNSKK